MVMFETLFVVRGKAMYYFIKVVDIVKDNFIFSIQICIRGSRYGFYPLGNLRRTHFFLSQTFLTKLLTVDI